MGMGMVMSLEGRVVVSRREILRVLVYSIIFSVRVTDIFVDLF